MLPGRSLAARAARRNEIKMLGENVRLERTAGLRAAKYRCDVRSNQGALPRARGTSGTRAREVRHFENGEGVPGRESVRRLEPERRTQDDGERLLVARQGAAYGLDAGDVGGSGEHLEEEMRETPRFPVG